MTVIYVAIVLLVCIILPQTFRVIVQNGSQFPVASITIVLCALIAPVSAYRSLPFNADLVIAGLALLGASLSVVTNWPSFSSARLVGGGGLLIAAGLWLFVVNLISSNTSDFSHLLLRATPVLMLIFLVAAVGAGVTNRAVLAASLTLGLCASLIYPVLAGDPVWLPCTQFKCGPTGSLLAGPFSSENYLARYACLVAVVSGVWATRNLRALLWGTALLITFLAESRSSQVALLAATVLALWVLMIRSPKGRATVAAVVAFIFFIVAGALLYVTPTDGFSNRGGIWLMGTRALGDFWLVGRGLDTWAVEVLSRNFMHSQALFFLYSGGVVALVLYVSYLVAVIRRAGGEPHVLLVAFFLMGVGMTEVLWNPLALDEGVIALYALLILGFGGANVATVSSADGLPQERLRLLGRSVDTSRTVL